MNRLDDLLRRGASDATALVAGEQSITYAELDARVSAVAIGLTALGIAKGDRVAIWLPKRIETVVMSFAISRAGAVLVPINPVLKAGQVAHILSDSGARLLLTSTARAATLESVETEFLLTVEKDWSRLIAHHGAATVEPSHIAAILYTSGSTGRPKGVVLSHGNLLIGAASVVSYIGHQPHDRILCVLPLSFDAGFSQVTAAFHTGAAAVLVDYLSPRDVVKAVARHGITHITGVPPLWTQLADANWPDDLRNHVQCIASTGGRMSRDLVARLRRLFPVARLFLMYGLTEAFRSTYLDPELVDQRADSIGKAIPDAEILVVRPDGRITDPDEPGELVHVGPLVSQGYWGDPARTAEIFRPAPPAAVSGKIGVWSGDTVRRDADGFLYFVGRTDEMIKTSGYRVSPTDVEEAALAIGVVHEAVAIGVADDRLGQAIHLVASPRMGMDVQMADTNLRQQMAAAVPAYMMPGKIHWRSELPRNANGKLDRAALRREFG